MNRRTFLTWTLASCALGIAGCGPRPVASSPVTAAVAAPEVLSAPPLGAKAAAQPTLPDRMEIPAIDVDIPVVELGWSHKTDRTGEIFSEWDVAEYAAGWHKNSALPGQSGNVVMSGHNNILGAVFRELDQLKRDDPITVWVGANRYDYAVDQVVVVPDKGVSTEQRVENARWIGDFDDDRLTLVSCWPRNNNTHRIIVVARPADSQATR